MRTIRSLLDRRAFLSGVASLAGAAGMGSLPARLARAAAPVSHATIFKRGDAEYENKRQNLIWQALKPARFPDRIVEITSADDVVAAIASARADKRRVSIVSCGHSYVGNGIRDDTVLIDMGNLHEATVDAASKTASLQPGVRAFDFDALLQKENLAFPVAHNPMVGLAGFLLGGGMGWNSESWNNLACFNLRSIEAVLASGEKIVADSKQHADLFWAASGGGPFFPAVVTRFHVDVFARPSAIRESTFVYAIDAAPKVIDWMDKAHAVQDPKVELTLIMATSDPAENNGKAEKQCIVSFVCFADDEAEAKRLSAAITRDAPTDGLIFKDELSPKTIGDLLSEDKAAVPTRHAVETLWTRKPEIAVRIAAKQFLSSPTPTTLVYANYRARPSVPPGGVYSAMGSAFMFSDVSWDDAKDDAVNRKWSDGFIASLSAVDGGAYINETEFVRHPQRARHCYSDDNWLRLKQVVAKYDPTGLFVSPLNPQSSART